MKYSEAKSRIKDLLESKYGDEWSDHYRFEDWDSYFVLLKRDDTSKLFKVILVVNEEDPGCFEVRKLGISEKPLADIFMELALTPLEEREEEKKYVVKVGRMGLSEKMMYLGANKGTDKFWMGFGGPRGIDNSMIKTVFTQAEINQLKNKSTLNIDWDKAVEEYDGEI